MKHLIFVTLFVLSALAIEAQEVTTTVKTPVPPTTVQIPALAKAPIEAIASSAVRTVKGAPFSAEAVSESVQILGDGNRITRSYTTKMYRDSEGRFRREGGSEQGSGNSAVVMGGSAMALFGLGEMISIFDPVENVRYSLDPKNKTARRIGSRPLSVGTGVTVAGQTSVAIAPLAKVQVEAGVSQTRIYTQVAPVTSVGGVTVVSPVMQESKYETKTESLGTRNVDGVDAEGQRTVTTIPAGAIGNERPIEVVYERWYSKDLQMIVFSKHYDPRFGEQTYRLTNISRSEPDRSLFTPPSDFKIISEPGVTVYTTKPQ